MMNGNWRTRGDIVPWALSIMLGLMLGVALIIFFNAAPSATTAEEGDKATPAVEMADGTQSVGESGTMTNDSPAGASVGSEETTASGGDTDEVATDKVEADKVEANKAESGDTAEVTPADTQPTDTAQPASSEPTEVSEGAEGTEAFESPAVAAADADPEAGKQVFVSNNCAGCHGADAGGGFGPSLTAIGKDWSVTELATALRDGKTPTGAVLGGGMPKFSAEQIGDQDVANLHAWLATQ